MAHPSARDSRSGGGFVLVCAGLARRGEERRRSGRTGNGQNRGETQMPKNSTNDCRPLDEGDQAQAAATEGSSLPPAPLIPCPDNSPCGGGACG
jgi:hypothetical protein